MSAKNRYDYLINTAGGQDVYTTEYENVPDLRGVRIKEVGDNYYAEMQKKDIRAFNNYEDNLKDIDRVIKQPEIPFYNLEVQEYFQRFDPLVRPRVRELEENVQFSTSTLRYH